MSPTRRGLVLCADDFAIAPGVSQGILDLARRGRLSAVSCMTASPFWTDHAPALRDLADRLDVGLHLTLTDQTPLGAMPRTAPAGRLPALRDLWLAGVTGRLAVEEVAAEIARQLGAFETAMGRPPDFVDGHQHAHVLPGVRALVLDAVARAGARRPMWLRSCEERPARIARRRVAVGKALVIATLSAGLSRAAARRGIATNIGFGGVLDQRRGGGLARAMPRFLDRPGARPLVMCHPGVPDATLAALDPLVAPRAAELAYLGGPAFAADLDRAGVELARFARAGRILGSS